MAIQGYSLPGTAVCSWDALNVYRVPPPACCQVVDKNETPIEPHITSLEAELKQKIHSFENSLLMSVERRSLAFGAVLMSISMAILLIGTCIVSCRSDETLIHYQPLSQEEWDNLSAGLTNGYRVDIKNHLYAAPFREPMDTQ